MRNIDFWLLYSPRVHALLIRLALERWQESLLKTNFAVLKLGLHSPMMVFNKKCIPWRRQWQATPVLLPGKSHGWRSLVGCSPWGRYESDATEWLHFHFSLSRNGEGNGNPLQCSCLKNPRDGGAWWAAIYGVAQIRTRLMRLSSSRSIYTR